MICGEEGVHSTCKFDATNSANWYKNGSRRTNYRASAYKFAIRKVSMILSELFNGNFAYPNVAKSGIVAPIFVAKQRLNNSVKSSNVNANVIEMPYLLNNTRVQRFIKMQRNDSRD